MRKLPYHESYLCFITTVTKNRRIVFTDQRLADRLGTMIHMACRLKGFTPLVYAILPDHFHLLVISTRYLEGALERAPSPPTGGIKTVVGAFSQRARETARSQAGKIPSTVEGGLSRPPGQQPPDSSVAALTQSIKGTFSRTMKAGPVWQRGNFTWFIDDASSAGRVVDYITLNAWRAGLPRQYVQAPYVWVDHEQIGNLLS